MYELTSGSGWSGGMLEMQTLRCLIALPMLTESGRQSVRKLCVCGCVCVCVRERERERGRVCVCVCVSEGERERESVCV